jgi:anti-sigma B factor antagonist
MDEAFDVSVAQVDGVPVVSVSGEVDVATAPILRDRLQELSAGGASTVVIDLQEMTFLDSTGLGVLVGALKRCREGGGELRLVAAQPRILKLLDITGLMGVFPLHETVAAACEQSK